MRNTDDFVICVISSETTAICTDHSATNRWVDGWVGESACGWKLRGTPMRYVDVAHTSGRVKVQHASL